MNFVSNFRAFLRNQNKISPGKTKTPIQKRPEYFDNGKSLRLYYTIIKQNRKPSLRKYFRFV